MKTLTVQQAVELGAASIQMTELFGKESWVLLDADGEASLYEAPKPNALPFDNVQIIIETRHLPDGETYRITGIII